MTPTPGEGRPLTDRLVSPNGFDGYGPVPDKVYVAARKIAKLRTRFVSQWTPGCEQPLATTEVDALFQAAAVRAEWERELIEARDALTRERDALLAVVEAARELAQRYGEDDTDERMDDLCRALASLPPVADERTYDIHSDGPPDTLNDDWMPIDRIPSHQSPPLDGLAYVTVDRQHYRVKVGSYIYAAIRSATHVPDDYDLWMIRPGKHDIKVEGRIDIDRSGLRFFTAPKHINASAPVADERTTE